MFNITNTQISSLIYLILKGKFSFGRPEDRLKTNNENPFSSFHLSPISLVKRSIPLLIGFPNTTADYTWIHC